MKIKLSNQTTTNEQPQKKTNNNNCVPFPKKNQINCTYSYKFYEQNFDEYLYYI